ncbi:MAG: hypothetical protein ACP5I8_07570 [Phycisphaerae bacterium]
MIDDLIDTAHESISVAVRERCCRLGIDSGSFKRAAESLPRVGQLSLSDELLPKIVESEGKAALAWQDKETVPLNWGIEDTTTKASEDGSSVRRMCVGSDGFILPMVTKTEQVKRHQKVQTRRKKPRRKHSAAAPQPKIHAESRERGDTKTRPRSTDFRKTVPKNATKKSLHAAKKWMDCGTESHLGRDYRMLILY